jgi:hypothetical protein
MDQPIQSLWIDGETRDELKRQAAILRREAFRRILAGIDAKLTRAIRPLRHVRPFQLVR